MMLLFSNFAEYPVVYLFVCLFELEKKEEKNHFNLKGSRGPLKKRISESAQWNVALLQYD